MKLKETSLWNFKGVTSWNRKESSGVVRGLVLGESSALPAFGELFCQSTGTATLSSEL